MIRIVHLIDDTNQGGVTRATAAIAAALGEGFDVRVLPVRTAWRLAPRLPADLLVVDFTLNWAKLPFLAALRARNAAPVLLVEHSYTEGYEARRVPARWRFRAMLRLGYAMASRVVAVSHGQGAWLRAAALAPPSRLAVLPQALDVAALADLPAPAPGPGPLRLGAYGRYADQKGFDVLIAAMRRVPPEAASLTLAGYGPEEARLREAAAGLAHVRITGAIDGPRDFLAGLDAVAVPSRWEAYGLVAQEARAAGRPVIASAVDGLSEQIGPAEGLLVPPEDPAALAEAILRLATAPRHGLAPGARAEAASGFPRRIAAWRALCRQMAGAPECESA